MRFAVDTGGTFTDLVVEDDDGRLRLYKSPTTPADPVEGVLDVLAVAARDLGVDRAELLGRSGVFTHGTTWATNAILTGTTARTAFLTTKGHPDILLCREGGRSDPFDYTRPYPDPYVPRALTFEVPERIGSLGEIVAPLDEQAVVEIAGELRELEVEAVGVCLLWSIVNPAHEVRVGELLDEHLPGVPYTLSHELNPTLREYRRASSACIDASLKPVMTGYLRGLEGRLRSTGFNGRVLMVTSSGGVLDAALVAGAPIHSLGSGPAMAPVAGRYYAVLDADSGTAVIADTGGTSYDVSLVRRGRIPWTRETWLGRPYLGHMTGFPSVDVKSIGAGGGSIAWVDGGGLLHVGPESAGSVPGPVCYGRGGTRPTVTDAALVLGYIDPEYFLGGAMELDVEAARRALEEVGERLGLDADEVAAAVLEVATEHMVRAIEEITLHQGIDPRSATLVGGGGAAGLNAVAIGRRLGSPRVIIPEIGAALSAAGALMSALSTDYAATFRTTTEGFDRQRVNEILTELSARCSRFAAQAGAGAAKTTIELSAEARYPHQIWELEVPLRGASFDSQADVERFRQDFHSVHEEVFAIADRESAVEIVSWRARVHCRLGGDTAGRLVEPSVRRAHSCSRRAYFSDAGAVEARVFLFEELSPGESIEGPAIIESPVTTVVIDPGATVERTASGSLSIVPGIASARPDRAGAREGLRAGDGSSETRAGRVAIDGVRLAVLNNRFEGVVRSMMNTLLRTARSGVLNTARDLSCCILTTDCELLATAESLPIHVLSGPDLMARSMMHFHPRLRRGDAFLHNSPYHGNSHAADYSILVPVIDDDGVHRFTVLAKGHQADCGNSLPTAYHAAARDVYEEGALIFPCVKVQQDYKDNADVIRMCEMRIRVPEQWWGDHLALLGAARIGERRMLELGAEVGWDTLEAYARQWFDYSEQQMITAIRKLPSGRVIAESAHDPFPGVPAGIPVKVTVEVDGEQALVEVDLRDNPDCQPCGLNLTESYRSHCRNARDLQRDPGTRCRPMRGASAACGFTCARIAASASHVTPRRARSPRRTSPTVSRIRYSALLPNSPTGLAWPRWGWRSRRELR